MDVKERNLLGGGENIVEMVDLDEENFAVSNSSDSDAAFDAVIGSIEDIIMEDDFQHMQQSFMEKHYLEFDDSEENKLTYTPIFNEYIELLEKQLEQQLMERIPGFNMSTFTQLLKQHKDEVSGDIFDMLLTFTDFMTFKEMFIDYRAHPYLLCLQEREGRGLDLSDGLVVKSLSSTSSKAITSRTTTKLK
uniref:ADP-ribosylation factor-like protein 2-binding protein isoform X1 n=1 Tax=Oncorhynchus gorbuscha TaxID=8017 RepID=UPI001EAEBFCB|nr:ADP-ribosylation factor-like protein 2-binding protein isoform X1 [Oncorhynchus gorbuscha]